MTDILLVSNMMPHIQEALDARHTLHRLYEADDKDAFLASVANKIEGVATMGKADAALIRAQTGFAIGGVSPVGHLTPPRAFFDPRLLDFDTVWAAAGTPRHVIAAAPLDMMHLTGASPAHFTTETT